MADFLPAYKITMAHESGYANDPKDKGGETYRGISRVNHPTWAGWATVDNVKKQFRNGIIPRYTIFKDAALEKLVQDFYLVNYWTPKAKGYSINNQDTANLIFDMVVNHGRGAMIVNRAVNKTFGKKVIAEDNKITADTLHYLNNNTEKIYPNIIAARKEYVQSLDDYATFGKGWMNRINSFPASIVVAGGAAILLLFAAVFF